MKNEDAGYIDSLKEEARTMLDEAYEDGISANEMNSHDVEFLVYAADDIYNAMITGKPGMEVLAAIEAFPATRLVASKAQKEAYETIKTEVQALNTSLKEEISDLISDWKKKKGHNAS